MPSNEILQGCAAVHVGHRHKEGVVGFGRSGWILSHGRIGPSSAFEHRRPIALNFLQRRHVCHRASCAQGGHQHRLFVVRQHIGGLCHEVDATKHDVRGIRIRCFLAQHEGVTNVIGVFDDTVALVVVPEDEDLVAQASTHVPDGRRDVLLLGGLRRVHVVDDTHWERGGHLPRFSHPRLPFQPMRCEFCPFLPQMNLGGLRCAHMGPPPLGKHVRPSTPRGR